MPKTAKIFNGGCYEYLKKNIVVKDSIKLWRNEDGILIIGILEFLLNKNSLDL